MLKYLPKFFNLNFSVMPSSNTDLPPSLWQLKPWWCQPWSIVLTGIVIPLGSWLWLGWWWVTLPLGLLMGLWWFVFLYLVPQQYRLEVLQANSENPTQT
jgi:membrane protein YdbS with pleckstrin-like domain